MKGKYAVKAANRLAELDAGIAAELQAKLAVVTAERDEARREAATFRDRLATEVHRAARELSEQRIADATQDLVAERRARSEDRERLGKETFAVFGRYSAWPQPGVMADLASVFGLSDRVGQLIPGGNRHSKRTDSGKLRHIQAARDAGEMK